MQRNTLFAITIILAIHLPLMANGKNLKTIMHQMGESMAQLDQGILRNDYSKIKQAAQDIANHPKPQGQLSTLVSALGFSMFKFKGLDGDIHDRATEIAQFATQKDMSKIINGQHDLLLNCIKCHQQFRPKIQKILKKK